MTTPCVAVPMTFIGGVAIRCDRCSQVSTTHSTFRVGAEQWCNKCQDHVPCTTWIFIYEMGIEPDYDRRGCATEGPAALGMSSGVKRAFTPVCALDAHHMGDHEDNITRDKWPA